jgi:hypothetical protein
MKITAFNISVFVLLAVQPIMAQPNFHEVFPELPFSTEAVGKLNYQLVTVWHEEYKKSEGDEPGLPWANQTFMYQRERYLMPGGILDRSSVYTQENEKLSALQYYYIGKNVSAIDIIRFDTLMNEIIDNSYNFAYKDTIPYQKVKLFHRDKSFRLLYDFMFDKENRLIRLNITAHGEPKKVETLEMAEEDMLMVLIAYSGDSKTKRFYKNMHDLQRSERTQYNDKGLPISTKIKDGENQLIAEVIYIYEDELLVQENHTKYEDKQPFIDKTIYYRYNPNGLLDKIITEKGELQTISSFQYFEEY